MDVIEAGIIRDLHRLLARALEEGGRSFEQPVTVAEIYQELVPYSRARDELGFALNADFEHALMRLLSGEGGCARMEPENARMELIAELDSPDPNVTIYRRFAACDVYVAPPEPEDERAVGSPIQQHRPAPRGGSFFETAEIEAWASSPRLDDLAEPGDQPAGHIAFELDEPEMGDGARPEPSAAAAVTGGPTERPPTAAATSSCWACANLLPRGRPVRFCPWCGEDQDRRPCASCGELVERGWRFCVACGGAVEWGLA
ncbi:MAG: zinc ribbon domain-containing protein [Longimicrobiales bacterium]